MKTKAPSSTSNPSYRPPKHATPEALQQVIDDFFASPGHKSVTGLCLALGFSSRGTLSYHCEEPKTDAAGNVDPIKAEMVEIYKTAKLRIENYYETELMTAKNPVGAIFALKNMGWSDRMEQSIDTKSTVEHKISIADLPDDLAQQIYAHQTRIAPSLN